MNDKSTSVQNHQPRLTDPYAAPAVLPAMLALQQVINRCGLEPALMELVKLRASQINGCAFCIDMHFRDAKKRGENDNRLYLLDAWREVAVYSSRERAALAWTEALTRLSDEPVSDEVFAEASSEFSEAELLNLTLPDRCHQWMESFQCWIPNPTGCIAGQMSAQFGSDINRTLTQILTHV
jgi:AhpD family alkylhydroperoxidase